MRTCYAAYRAFWLRDYARIDVRLTKDNEVWFLEANANPFLSYGHDSAEAAHKAGLRYDVFIQRIIDEAMSRPAYFVRARVRSVLTAALHHVSEKK